MQATSPNYYDDADSPAPAADGDKPSAGKTAMLNKSVCGGKDCAPGDEITLRVVKDHGDELEVECCGSEEKGQEAPPETEGAPDQGGEMQSMLGD